MKRVVVPRLEPFDATVEVPGSKSIANRALICAALATGRSVLYNTPDGDDTKAMVACLGSLGVDVAPDGSAAAPNDVAWMTVDGGIETGPASTTGPGVPADTTVLDAGLAGTTSRFLIALAALGAVPITIDGAPPLRARPFGPLQDALRQLGVSVSTLDGEGHLPVTVTGPPTTSTARIGGDVSSQFVSALMMIGPYLADGLAIELTSPLVSRPYVDLTASVMASFGHDRVHIGEGDVPTITVAPGTYRACELTVEPDASSASYPMAMAAVAGGRVTVAGLGTGSKQGDAAFAQILASMGCDVEQTALSTRVDGSAQRQLRGIDIDMADISDLVPTVVAVAMFANGPTRISGVGFIRGKESDRLGDVSREMGKLGADIEVTTDGLVVNPQPLHGGTIDPHHDHRLAMAAAVVGAGIDGVVVDDAEVVAKSWPGFWHMRQALAGSQQR